MKNNQKTTNEGFNFIENKTLFARDILVAANAGKEANTNEWYNKMISDAMAQISAENTASRTATIDTWFDLVATKNKTRDTTVFFGEVLQNPYYTQFSVRPDKTRMGYFEMADRDVRIDFLTIDKAWTAKMDNVAETLAVDGRYSKMMQIFMANCIKNVSKDLSDGATKVIIPAMNGLHEEAKEYDFTSNSITALEKQLNVLATAIMGEFAPKMLKADVHFLLAATTKVVNNNRDAEEKGHLVTIRDRAFINTLFRAIKVRKDGTSYVIDSKAEIHKEAKKA